MTASEQLYAERLNRYVTAMRNGKPDKVPLRPFAAEFTATYAGMTCMEVTHDYAKAFEAVQRCAADFDWDAIVANMVYVWTGLTQAIGLEYYAAPGIDIPPGIAFQYLEPPEGASYMRDDEYDALIANPVDFLFNTWLPRVSKDVVPPGTPSTYRNNLSFLKGGMAMLGYFSAFGPQLETLRTQYAMPSAIAGILKAPMDILADKLRGYTGLVNDLLTQPAKVHAACEALSPHQLAVALAGADPDKNAPIAIWMHRGGVPFVTREHFETIYWPTLKPIIENIWAQGYQTLFYAEGDWNAHLDSFAELPPASIVYHVDKADIFEVHRALGGRFCISGGVPNYLLAMGTPQEVRDRCKAVIDGVAGDGGFIMDASAIMQNDAKVENVRAMTEATREFGGYGTPASVDPPPSADVGGFTPAPMPEASAPPGVCVPWEAKARELGEIPGNAALAKRVWEDVEALAYTYIWHCLESF